MEEDLRDHSAFAVATAPATCGELVQGYLQDHDFLITSPIDLFSSASVRLTSASGAVDVCGAAGSTAAYPKVTAAVSATLHSLGRAAHGATIEIHGTIPRSKGMASSSAEICAAIHATAEAIGAALGPFEICRLAVAIEPSDGVFFPGVVMLDHIRGTLLEFLGAPPSLSVVVVDTGGEVDTLRFDRERARAIARASGPQLLAAVDLVRRGFADQDGRMIAEGATLSARLHQAVLWKPPLEELCAATAEIGALGVNCAHSGTVLGVLYDPREVDCEAVVRRVEQVVGTPAILGAHRMIAGGSRIVRSSHVNATPAPASRQPLHAEALARFLVSENTLWGGNQE